MRTIWKGSISFGLVSIPIGLAVATQRSDIAFRTLHRECGTPIKQKRWCPTHEREVEADELVKGWEFSKGQYVVVEEGDLEAIALQRSHSIEIVRFVELADVDPIYFDSPYYVAPDGAVAEETFRVIQWAMREKSKVALSRVVLSRRERHRESGHDHHLAEDQERPGRQRFDGGHHVQDLLEGLGHGRRQRGQGLFDGQDVAPLARQFVLQPVELDLETDRPAQEHSQHERHQQAGGNRNHGSGHPHSFPIRVSRPAREERDLAADRGQGGTSDGERYQSERASVTDRTSFVEPSQKPAGHECRERRADERDRRFRQRRGRVVGDHRRAHAGVERAVVKDDLRLSDLNATAGSQMNRAFDSGAVVERAVCRTEILEHVFVSLATHLSVYARREWIRNTQIVPSGTADSYTKPAEWKMVGGAVWVFNY